MITLDRLLTGQASAPPLPISGLCLDSRRLRPGEVFIALAGRRSHGLGFVPEALARGASAVLYEPPADGRRPALPVPAIAIPGLGTRLGALADRYYGAPSLDLRVVGITGTNGKTSTSQLYAQALTARGRRVAVQGTLGAGIHPDLQPIDHTTPDAVQTQRWLAEVRARGVREVVMEVSSHALDQARVAEVRFCHAVFTNLSRDHLDYHGDLARYAAAKARLFAWPSLRSVWLNADDPVAATMQRACLPHTEVRRYAIDAMADLRAERIEAHGAGLGFVLAGLGPRQAIRSSLLGRFNVYNLLAVAGLLLDSGVPWAELPECLSALRPVAGRMTRLGGGEEPLVVIDYAHTPDALEQALGALAAHAQGRLWCVFGCGGERDRGKRPQMAAIAERLADHVIVTDDNPRGEDGEAIVAEILAGFRSPQAVAVERERARAIELAVGAAGAGDVVLIAGKGHETYQEVAGVRRPFDDLAVARAALARRRGVEA